MHHKRTLHKLYILSKKNRDLYQTVIMMQYSITESRSVTIQVLHSIMQLRKNPY